LSVSSDAPLLVNQQLRVTNDVHEQDMGNLELDLFFDLSGHLLPRNSAQIPRLHQARGETAVTSDEAKGKQQIRQWTDSPGRALNTQRRTYKAIQDLASSIQYHLNYLGASEATFIPQTRDCGMVRR
jgi:hypothetical protein